MASVEMFAFPSELEEHIFNDAASPKLFLFASRFVAVCLLYNKKSLISSLRGEKHRSYVVTIVERPTG